MGRSALCAAKRRAHVRGYMCTMPHRGHTAELHDQVCPLGCHEKREGLAWAGPVVALGLGRGRAKQSDGDLEPQCLVRTNRPPVC